MTQLDTLLHDLEQTDMALSKAPLGDFHTLEVILHYRATLIQQAAAVIDTLRDASPEHRAALLRSKEASCQALRQLIFAKHLLATELSQLKQEQRLWDALSGQARPTAPGFNLQG